MSTLPIKIIEDYLSEGNDYVFRFKSNEDLSGSVLTFLIRPERAETGVTTLGTANGALANVAQNITLSYSNYEVGSYLVEVWRDIGTPDEAIVFPPDNVRYRVYIQDRIGISVAPPTPSIGIFDNTFDLTFA